MAMQHEIEQCKQNDISKQTDLLVLLPELVAVCSVTPVVSCQLCLFLMPWVALVIKGCPSEWIMLCKFELLHTYNIIDSLWLEKTFKMKSSLSAHHRRAY